MRALPLLLAMAGCSGSPAVPALPETPDAAPEPTVPGTVVTQSGKVTGELAGETYAFRGIPYATAARFENPQPVTWEGERIATQFGSVCPQWEDGAVVGEESCLFLNLWTPKAYAEADRRPVLVFIHGGGHQQGSSSQKLADGQPLYDGRRFVESSGAVVVTFNYRLGPLGFLTHGDLPGNYGMRDQIAALEWVKANIARFGGDPARVMIFGESAGAVSVCRLMISPLAKGLFSAALMQSGACVATPLARAQETGAAVARTVGCADTKCLREAPLAKLMEAVPRQIDISAFGRLSYDGVVDGTLVPAAPLDLIAQGKHHHVPFVVGSNSAETGNAVPAIPTVKDYEDRVTALVGAQLAPAVLAQYPASDHATPRAAYVALTSDAKFTCSARKAARAVMSAQTEPVYRYVFTHVAENAPAQLKALGAFHGSELPYVFGNVAIGAYTPGPGDLAVVSALSGFWSRFAASGDPGWTRYAATDPYMRIASTPVMESGYRTKQCDFWDSLAP